MRFNIKMKSNSNFKSQPLTIGNLEVIMFSITFREKGMQTSEFFHLTSLNCVRNLLNGLIIDGFILEGRCCIESYSLSVTHVNKLTNLVPRAHVPFGPHQDTELRNNQFPETKILGLPASRRMRGLVYMASRDKVDLDTFYKGIQYAMGKIGKSKFGFESTTVSNFKSKRHEGSGNELVDYSRAPCLGADQKARGRWERDCKLTICLAHAQYVPLCTALTQKTSKGDL